MPGGMAAIGIRRSEAPKLSEKTNDSSERIGVSGVNFNR
jgi:hypothetical protein